ncbi:MAG: hypothetical protein KDJ36_07375 [Hyphomicrobiaceae bacterium]|nr:hypothetical protein [Hyphomicrobiaceae bacterium]
MARFRFGLIVWVLCLLGLPVTSATAKPCHRTAIATLKRFSPEGFRVFSVYPDKSDFKRWIECSDVQGGLATAVHETIHAETSRLDGYPLLAGGLARRVAEGSPFYPPRLLRGMFPADSPFVESYLTTGAASSADHFRYLLDEFNAYAHDLNTVVKLDRIRPTGFESGHRDGLAAMMAFVATYAEVARQRFPATWVALKASRTRTTVVALWRQAEETMGRSCHLARYSIEAPAYLQHVCGKTDKHGIGQLLGRPPLCPIRCTMTARGDRRTGITPINRKPDDPIASLLARVQP